MNRTRLLFITTIIFLLNLSARAFSENWYLINECDLNTESEKIFHVRVVAKVRDENSCYELAGMRESTLAGGSLVSTACSSGEEYDKALTGVFNKVPAEEPYVRFKDKYGNETVVDFLFVKHEDFAELTEMVLDACKKEECTDIEVIEPLGEREGRGTRGEGRGTKDSQQISSKSERRDREAGREQEEKEEYLFIGSSKEDALHVMGEPSEVIGKVWFYGKDMINFDKDGKLIDFSDFSGTLKIKE
ncbi:MAG: hypothetical protein ABH862_00880 [Candidatus Omnitrophota bacterium]